MAGGITTYCSRISNVSNRSITSHSIFPTSTSIWSGSQNQHLVPLEGGFVTHIYINMQCYIFCHVCSSHVTLHKPPFERTGAVLPELPQPASKAGLGTLHSLQAIERLVPIHIWCYNLKVADTPWELVVHETIGIHHQYSGLLAAMIYRSAKAMPMVRYKKASTSVYMFNIRRLRVRAYRINHQLLDSFWCISDGGTVPMEEQTFVWSLVLILSHWLMAWI